MHTTDVRRSRQYVLYRGHGNTAELYNVLRLETISKRMSFTDSWLNESQKDELLKLSEEEFDRACSKINFVDD